MPYKPNKNLDYFHIVDIALIDSDRNTTPLPMPTEYGYGTYTGYYPYIAAQKAVTGVYKWMKKHYDFDDNNAPHMVFLLQRFDGKLFGFYGKRVIHSQAPRELMSPEARHRVHHWRSVVYKIEPSALGY
jgi:hypothetical protein